MHSRFTRRLARCVWSIYQLYSSHRECDNWMLLVLHQVIPFCFPLKMSKMFPCCAAQAFESWKQTIAGLSSSQSEEDRDRFRSPQSCSPRSSAHKGQEVAPPHSAAEKAADEMKWKEREERAKMNALAQEEARQAVLSPRARKQLSEGIML